MTDTAEDRRLWRMEAEQKKVEPDRCTTPCERCAGTGIVAYLGKAVGYSLFPIREEVCPRCNGTGRCQGQWQCVGTDPAYGTDRDGRRGVMLREWECKCGQLFTLTY